MLLLLILFLPAVAGAVSLAPLGRRAAAVTLAAAALVLGLALRVAAAARQAPVTTLGGRLGCDGLGALILLLAAFVGFAAALYSWGYIRRRAGARGRERLYYTLFNLFLLAVLAVPLIVNIALLWVALELTTLASTFLVGFDDTPEALEAAWKFVVVTTLGAILALLGILLLFAAAQVAGHATFTWPGLVAAAPRLPPAILWPAFLLILVGFAAKLGLVPVHSWVPDAYSRAPSSICALLSGAEAAAVIYVILRLLPVLDGSAGLAARPWYLGVGLASVAVATLLLVFVRDLKRLFAYSTIEHMGIILFAAGLGGAEAHLGAAFQLAAHSIAKSFCFFAAGLAAMAAGTQEIAELRGLARRAPLAAAALMAGAFAIAGAPPFALFVSEFLIVKGGLAGGHFLLIGVLAVLVALAFAAILFHVTRMVFGGGEGPAAAAAPLSCRATILVAAVPLVLIGVWVPAPFYDLLRTAAAAIGG
jgi:hydrogenase-4 component F